MQRHHRKITVMNTCTAKGEKITRRILGLVYYTGTSANFHQQYPESK